MTDAKDAQQPVSQTDVAKKETSKPSKKLKSTTVKDVISKTRTMTGSPPDQININPFQESAQHEHTAVMAFGRFNPPTVGHEKLIHKVEQTAKSVGGSAHIIASHSEGDSKNPLPSDKKVGYIKKIADHGTHVYASSKAQPSLLHHAAALHKHAHHLVVVAGQDRVSQFHDLLHKYNGKEGPHGFYNFKSIKVVSAGQRDPDAEGTKGMSGTKMREHAKNGNETAFRRGLPKALHAHASEIMKHIQKVTGVEKAKKEALDIFAQEVHKFIMENTPITNAQQNALEIKSIKSGIEVDQLIEAYAYGYHTGLMSEAQSPEQVGFQSVNSLIANSLFINEDLRQWFKDKWVRMDTKGNIKGDCAREPGEGKPKCLPLAKARAMDKDDRATAARRKRREDPVADRAGKGGKPINVRTEEYIEEKNAPTNPALWARAKSLARSKFDVYPSAYANGWASKWYKSKGGGWKSVSEEVNHLFAEKFGKDREAVARSGQEPKDKDLVMRDGDRKVSDKGYRQQSIEKQVIEDVDTAFESVFLLSEAADKMVGTIGSDRKGLRHLKNYVMPYLNSAGRKKTAASFAEHGKLEHSGHGEQHDPKATHNFTLATKQGKHPAGTHVKVTHVSQGPNNSLIAHTEKHGAVSMGALFKPQSLKKPAITREGFGVEGKIATNLGTKAAGSTKHGYDFHYGSGEHEVRGKVKEIEPDKKTGGATPLVRGESKLDKGKMGQSTLKHTKEKGWHFTNASLASHMEKTQINGKPILEHLNKHHPDGKIDRAYTVPAPKGMAQHYLKTSNVNTLHLHNKKEGHGTTFTIGDKNNLKGKSKLGHLSNKDLERLNGTITIEKTTTGSTQVAHRPKHSVMKEFANMSKTDSANHRDLTNKAHADEFKNHINKMNESTTTANLAPYSGPMKIRSVSGKVKKVKNVAIRMANGKIKRLPPGKSGSSGGGGSGGDGGGD